MPPNQVTLLQDDFSAGMVRDVAPHLIPETGAYDIVDGLLDEDGSVYERGGTTEYSDTAFDAGLRFAWDGHVSAGQRTLIASASNFGIIDSGSPVDLGGDGLTYPVASAVIEGMLFLGGGYIYAGSEKAAPYSTGTVSVTNGSTTVTGSGVTWNTLVDAGMLFQIGNERVYVVESVTDSTHLELRDAYEGSTASGQAYTLHNIYEITNADPYLASSSYAVAANRLLAHDGEQLRFSPLRQGSYPISYPHSFPATESHDIPEGVSIIGIASIGGNALIFTTGGVWRVSGLAYNITSAEGTPQHSVEPLSRDIVLWGTAGIASWEQYLIVPATDGIYLMDGTSAPVPLARSIAPLYRDYVATGYRAGGGCVYRGHYFLPILGGAAGVKDVLVCRLDKAIRDRRRKVSFPWSHFSGHGGTIGCYAVRHNEAEPTTPILLGADWGASAKVSNCSSYFDPGVSVKEDADGSSFQLDLILRDFETGNNTVNRIRSARLEYELEADTGDDPHFILDYSTGAIQEGQPRWGDPNGVWGTGFGPSGTGVWTASGASGFVPTTRDDIRDYAPPSVIEPHRFPINAQGRHIRPRIRTHNDPAARAVVRSLELVIRPSLATRR